MHFRGVKVQELGKYKKSGVPRLDGKLGAGTAKHCSGQTDGGDLGQFSSAQSQNVHILRVSKWTSRHHLTAKHKASVLMSMASAAAESD